MAASLCGAGVVAARAQTWPRPSPAPDLVVVSAHLASYTRIDLRGFSNLPVGTLLVAQVVDQLGPEGIHFSAVYTITVPPNGEFVLTMRPAAPIQMFRPGLLVSVHPARHAGPGPAGQPPSADSSDPYLAPAVAVTSDLPD